MGEPIAYFITFTTYGMWLYGRSPGSVDREHNQPGTPFLPGDSRRERTSADQMRQASYLLDEGRRQIVLATIREVTKHRGWRLWAVYVRSNHVHVVVSAAAKPEKLMADFKAWPSRRLREAYAESSDRDRWTQHGSTKYVWNENSLEEIIRYVLDEQGERMACFDGRIAKESEPEA